MSDPKSNSDSLSQTESESGIELDEKQLDKVSGGIFSKLGDIKGESTDSSHKDW